MRAARGAGVEAAADAGEEDGRAAGVDLGHLAVEELAGVGDADRVGHGRGGRVDPSSPGAGAVVPPAPFRGAARAIPSGRLPSRPRPMASPAPASDVRSLIDRIADALGADASSERVERVARAVLAGGRTEAPRPRARRARPSRARPRRRRAARRAPW